MPNAMTHVALIFPVAVLSFMLFLPLFLSRDGLLLGIHVSEEFRASEQARQLRSRYVLHASLLALCALGLAAFGASRGPWLLLAAVALDVAGIFVLWISNWRRLHSHRPTPGTVRAAQLAPQSSGMPWALEALAALLPLGAAAAVLAKQWQSIPARFAVHWGANGQPNGWSERTPLGVFGMLLLGALLVALLAALGELIPRVSPGFQGNRQVLQLTRNVLCACAWMIALLFSGTSLLPLMHDATRAVPWLIAGTFLLLGMIVVYLVAGARRIMPAMAAAQDCTSDRYWLAGMIYFNPGDPAVMVPKRMGVGYTLNFGRPVAWVVMGGLVILPVVLSVALRPK